MTQYGILMFQINMDIKSINLESSKQKITAKQAEFARLIAEEHLTSSDAYRQAYVPKSSVKNKSIHEMASKTFNNIKVVSRIKAIQHQRAEDQRMLAIKRSEFIMKQLEKEAMDLDNNSSSRIRALELMGKSAEVGLFVDKVEMKSENINMTAEELQDQLKEKLQKLIGNN